MTTVETPAGLRRIGWDAALVGMAVSALMQTYLATVTPTLVAELANPDAYGWVNGAYLVASVTLLVLSAAITDRVGPRRTYVAGMGLYVAGTVLVSVSPSMAGLLAGRVVQGCGARILVPAALSVVAMVSSDAVRGRAFGVMGLVQVLANVVGPVLGGWFAAGPGWRWGVAATIPLALIGLTLAALHIPRGGPIPQRWWVLHRHDMFPVAAARLVTVPLAMAFLAGGLVLSVVTFAPWSLAALHGASAQQTGLLLVPLFVGSAVGSVLGSRLVSKPWGLSVAWLFAAAGVLVGLPNRPWAISAGAAVVALGCSMVLPIVLTTVQSRAPESQMAATSSLVQVARHAGSALLVPALGIWTTSATAPVRGGFGLLTCLFVTALGGLILTRRTR